MNFCVPFFYLWNFHISPLKFCISTYLVASDACVSSFTFEYSSGLIFLITDCYGATIVADIQKQIVAFYFRN